jgi:hypothetical protein
MGLEALARSMLLLSDPASGTWKPTGSLAAVRSNYTTTLRPGAGPPLGARLALDRRQMTTQSAI